VATIALFLLIVEIARCGPVGVIVSTPKHGVFSPPESEAALTESFAGPPAKETGRTSSSSTQADIKEGCILVTNISSHKLVLLSGIATPVPAIGATVTNACTRAMSISLNIGYFNSTGKQFGQGIELVTVARGERRNIYHVPRINGSQQARLRTEKIISVRASR
jgi:hypothetical protein